MSDLVTGISNALALKDLSQDVRELFEKRAARRNLITRLDNLLQDYVLDSDLPDKFRLGSNLREKRIAQKLIKAGSEEGYITLLKQFGILNGASRTPQEAELIKAIEDRVLSALGSVGERQAIDRFSKLEPNLAIAEVVRGSMPDGAVVQSGDRVILEEVRSN